MTNSDEKVNIGAFSDAKKLYRYEGEGLLTYK